LCGDEFFKLRVDALANSSDSEPEFGEEYNYPVGDHGANHQKEDLEWSNAGLTAKNFALQSFPGGPMKLVPALAAFGCGPKT
jgi:hypothetical protein